MAAKAKKPRSNTKKAEKLPVTRSDSYMSVYSNQANISITRWDVRMIFGEISTGPDDPHLERKFDVVMSHAHFEHFLEVMHDLWSKNKDKFKKLQLP